MKFKKLFAAASACVVAAFSMIAMSVYTSAETEIAYTGPSEGAMSTADNGTDLRLNIYNDWSTVKIKDINPNGTFEKNITVTFTVSGLGTKSCNIKDDGTNGDPFKANLSGTIGTNEALTGNPDTAINGDGQYTVTFPLTAPANSITCLYIQSNINKTKLDNEGKDVVFKVDKIVADAASVSAAAPTDANGNAITTPINNLSAATTTANANNTAIVATTTASSALGNSTQVNSSATGDNGVTSFVIVGIVSAAAAVATQIKRKK